MKIQVSGRIRYPDAFIVCTPVRPHATVVTEPAAIFEILSASSKNDDLIVKNAEYRGTPSVRHYVILQQNQPAAIIFSRKGEEWVSTLLTSADTVLDLNDLELHIPLAEIYDGLTSDTETPGAAHTPQ